MNRRNLLYVYIASALIIVGALLYAFYYNPGEVATNNGNNPVVTTQPVFSGLDQLIEVGVTSDQVNSMESTLRQYLSSINKNPTSVKLNDVQKISTNYNSQTPIWTLTFTIQLDKVNTYKAKMDYSDIADIRLYLYSVASNNLIYDSQQLNGSSGTAP